MASSPITRWELQTSQPGTIGPRGHKRDQENEPESSFPLHACAQRDHWELQSLQESRGIFSTEGGLSQRRRLMENA